MRGRRDIMLLALLAFVPAAVRAGESAPAAAERSKTLSAAPQSVDDLAAIERKVTGIVGKLSECTVAVRIGKAHGSGVIVTKDGYVLTAAHVAGKPGQDVVFTLHDGREVKGTSLGVDRNVDAGLLRITDKGEWPVAFMADSPPPELGTWCIALGHPGGYKKDRGPVVRLGRVILVRKAVLQTDCTLVGGDSGGRCSTSTATCSASTAASACRPRGTSTCRFRRTGKAGTGWRGRRRSSRRRRGRRCWG